MVFFLPRVEVDALAWDVLGQAEGCHALADGVLDDLFEGVGGMAAELAGVRVVGEGHCWGGLLIRKISQSEWL